MQQLKYCLKHKCKHLSFLCIKSCIWHHILAWLGLDLSEMLLSHPIMTSSPVPNEPVYLRDVPNWANEHSTIVLACCCTTHNNLHVKVVHPESGELEFFWHVFSRLSWNQTPSLIFMGLIFLQKPFDDSTFSYCLSLSSIYLISGGVNVLRTGAMLPTSIWWIYWERCIHAI